MASMSGPGFMEIREGVWLAGDYLTYPSINGAFQSANQLAFTFWLINSYSRDSGGIIYCCLAFQV